MVGLNGLITATIVNRYIAALIINLSEASGKAARASVPLGRTSASGSQVYKVWPTMASHEKDAVLGSARAYLYVQPGKNATRGEQYTARHARAAGGVCIVLGAGNAPFLSMIDVLHKMYNENYPVVLKHHDAQVCQQCVLLLSCERLRTHSWRLSQCTPLLRSIFAMVQACVHELDSSC
jgi:hypothetical protein